MLLGLLFGVLLFGLVALVVALPRQVTRTAYRNCRRRDGSWSRRRARREARHFAELFGALHLVVVLFVVSTGGAVALVHRFIVPIPLVVDVLRVYDPDPARWEANRERELDDVGDSFDAWREQQGFSEEDIRLSRDFLWNHWMSLSALFLIMGVFTYWFIARFFLSSVARYGRGVMRRREAYGRHQRHRT